MLTSKAGDSTPLSYLLGTPERSRPPSLSFLSSSVSWEDGPDVPQCYHFMSFTKGYRIPLPTLGHHLSAAGQAPPPLVLQLLTLGHGVWLHVPIIVLTGPNEATLWFHSLGHHVINEPVLIPDILSFKLRFVLPEKWEREENKRQRKLVLLGYHLPLWKAGGGAGNSMF